MLSPESLGFLLLKSRMVSCKYYMEKHTPHLALRLKNVYICNSTPAVGLRDLL